MEAVQQHENQYVPAYVQNEVGTCREVRRDCCVFRIIATSEFLGIYRDYPVLFELKQVFDYGLCPNGDNVNIFQLIYLNNN